MSESVPSVTTTAAAEPPAESAEPPAAFKLPVISSSNLTIGLVSVGVLVAVVAGVLQLTSSKKSGSGTTKPTTSTPKPVVLKCPVSFRGETFELCKTSEELQVAKQTMFHRYYRFQLNDDNGAPGLARAYWGDSLQGVIHTVQFLPGSNGNYIIQSTGNTTTTRQLIAYQASPASRNYPPNKVPTDSDVDTAQTLYPLFADLADNKLKGSISLTNVVTEWKMVWDDKDTNYFYIQVPDSSTTGANVKKFAGARLRIFYYDNGFFRSTSFEGGLSIYYAPLIFSKVDGVPNYSDAELSGVYMDQFTFGTTNKFL